jgi:hypothetical protein
MQLRGYCAEAVRALEFCADLPQNRAETQNSSSFAKRRKHRLAGVSQKNGPALLERPGQVYVFNRGGVVSTL